MPKSYVIAASILSVLLLILGVSIWRSGPEGPAQTDALTEESIVTVEEDNDSLSSLEEIPDESDAGYEPEQDVTRIILDDVDAEFDGINVKDVLSDKILLNEEVIERSTLEQKHEESDAILSD